MLLEIMLRRVLVQKSFMETQQGSTIRNFALDFVSPEELVINIFKRCQKSVMDCVATLSSRHKKLASIIFVNLLTEDHVA